MILIKPFTSSPRLTRGILSSQLARMYASSGVKYGCPLVFLTAGSRSSPSMIWWKQTLWMIQTSEVLQYKEKCVNMLPISTTLVWMFCPIKLMMLELRSLHRLGQLLLRGTTTSIFNLFVGYMLKRIMNMDDHQYDKGYTCKYI